MPWLYSAIGRAARALLARLGGSVAGAERATLKAVYLCPFCHLPVSIDIPSSIQREVSIKPGQSRDLDLHAQPSGGTHRRSLLYNTTSALPLLSCNPPLLSLPHTQTPYPDTLHPICLRPTGRPFSRTASAPTVIRGDARIRSALSVFSVYPKTSPGGSSPTSFSSLGPG